MLSIKELKAEASKRGVRIIGRDDYMQLVPLNTNNFDKWKVKYLAQHKKANDETRKRYAEYAKTAPNSYYAAWLKYPYTRPSDDELVSLYRHQCLAGTALSFEEAQSTHSCAITEFGSFHRSAKLDKHWDLLLQWYIQNSKRHYHKCAVTTQKSWDALNKALKKVGFEKRASENSNHGKYKVNVWEYIKK